MAELVHNCPRCGARSITFDVRNINPIEERYGWEMWWEAFAICRRCNRATIFVLHDGDKRKGEQFRNLGLAGIADTLREYLDVNGYVSTADMSAKEPPDHLPEDIEAVYREAAKCLAIGCYNAAATMFRLCIDLATREMLPDTSDEPNARTRRTLGLRLPWLFDNGLLPEALRDLSTCVREDGNDGAHAGTLTEDDAKDILDFTYLLLERIYTEPKRLEIAAERRDARRATPTDN